MGDVWLGARYFTDPDLGNGSTYNSIWTIALQYWVTHIIWLKGGVGFAQPEISDENDPDVSVAFDDETRRRGHGRGGHRGPAVVQLGAGSAGPRRATRFYSGGDLNNLAFMVGFNWY